MLILVQLVKNERTIARCFAFGRLDHPLDAILDEATEDSRVREPDLNRDGCYIEVIWINSRGRTYDVAKTVTVWPDDLARKKPSSTMAPDWLRETINRERVPA